MYGPSDKDWYFLVAFLLIIGASFGYACNSGCSYVRSHYTFEVKKTP